MQLKNNILCAAILTMGVGFSVGSAQAANENLTNAEAYLVAEEACQVALAEGTETALRAFRRQYWMFDTSCSSIVFQRLTSDSRSSSVNSDGTQTSNNGNDASGTGNNQNQNQNSNQNQNQNQNRQGN